MARNPIADKKPPVKQKPQLLLPIATQRKTVIKRGGNGGFTGKRHTYAGGHTLTEVVKYKGGRQVARKVETKHAGSGVKQIERTGEGANRKMVSLGLRKPNKRKAK